MAAGTWAWGQDTAVLEDYTGDLADGSGSATVVGSGDDEVVNIDEGENWTLPSVNTGTIEIELTYDQYQTGLGTGIIEYRTGNSRGNCESQSWTTYTIHFTSSGWVQVRLSKAA